MERGVVYNTANSISPFERFGKFHNLRPTPLMFPIFAHRRASLCYRRHRPTRTLPQQLLPSTARRDRKQQKGKWLLFNRTRQWRWLFPWKWVFTLFPLRFRHSRGIRQGLEETENMRNSRPDNSSSSFQFKLMELLHPVQSHTHGDSTP